MQRFSTCTRLGIVSLLFLPFTIISRVSGYKSHSNNWLQSNDVKEWGFAKLNG